MIEITLPWPPSVNRYWRHPTKGKLAGRHLISDEGRCYRAEVGWLLRAAKIEKIDGRIWAYILASPPDRRRRDLDNILKSLLDALGHGGAYEDDSQIDMLYVCRETPKEKGEVFVSLGNVLTEKMDDVIATTPF